MRRGRAGGSTEGGESRARPFANGPYSTDSGNGGELATGVLGLPGKVCYNRRRICTKRRGALRVMQRLRLAADPLLVEDALGPCNPQPQRED